nr:YidC/Oxa1 family membrane protein insertase [uncultured Sphaerochaeta sp.]
MHVLYLAIIHPLELLIEFFFIFFDKSFDDYGLAIVGISLVINLLALPLYHVAETLQRKERDVRIRLSDGVARIKEAFKGDEQYMILSTYYRQNHYHPAYALRSSVSLLIQVPFFIAAYNFLSHLAQLQGISFLFIPNLGAPDGMLSIGGISVNVLPIAMTLINIIAGAIYTKGFPLRDKIQLYAMALLFLALLYTSPAGLVFYWTLNNLFSLVKNVFYRLKRPLPVLYGIAVVGTIGLTIAIWIVHPTLSFANRIVFISGCLFVVLIPFLLKVGSSLYQQYLTDFAQADRNRNTLFLISGALLFLLHGLVIPANLISSSTIEFAFSGTVTNPLAYIGHTATVFFGLWVVWPFFVYAMAKRPMKAILAVLLMILSLSSLVNLFFFTGDYGIVSTLLQFENPSLLEASPSMMVLPFVVTLIIAVALFFAVRYRKARWIETAMMILALGSLASGLLQCVTIQREYREYTENLALADAGDADSGSIKPVFQFSKTGKNVVFIFLDRAMNSFFPTILEDLPQLQEQLKGFVYYPNTVSFGNNTLHGSPAMMGGYEYTPDAMNTRTNEKLVDKHNEALLVMPRLFLDEGYSVTITNPPYSNYKWEADYTPFRPYPEMKVMHHHGKFAVQYKKEHADVLDWDPSYESDLIKKRLPLFAIFKTSFPMIRRTLYEEGRYFQKEEKPQSTDGFIDAYAQLYYLNDLTTIRPEGDAFISISNDTPHQPVFLQSPEYEPRSVVTDTTTPLDGIEGIRPLDRSSYQINAASLKRLGLWFAYLQELGVYDNTRIIIVSDHGYELYSEGMKDFGPDRYNYNGYVPLFLVKDFGSTGPISIDKRFMTNADAPLFAVKDVVQNPLNPATQKNLYDQVNKKLVNAYYGPWDPRENTGAVFKHDPSHSFSVHDDIFVESNWAPIQH